MSEYTGITLKELVAQYLKEHGFSGLFLNGECACVLPNLMPCDSPCLRCEPGHHVSCDPRTCADGCDFHVERPAAPSEGKTRIAIEEVTAIMLRRAEINHLELENVEWTQNGKVIPVDPALSRGWDFTGLGPVDFAMKLSTEAGRKELEALAYRVGEIEGREARGEAGGVEIVTFSLFDSKRGY